MKQHPAVKIRNQILKREGWRLLKEFDTNQNEPDKDVVLVRVGKEKRVLRVGEHQPLDFFPNGYVGKHVVVPELYIVNRDVPYEVEEYLPGKLLCEVMKKQTAKELVPRKWLTLLIKGHFEFQEVAKDLNLQDKIYKRTKHIEKFFDTAAPMLGNLSQSVKQIAFGKKYKFFWTETLPCKWKYSDDNLIAMPGNKLGLIDNVNAGKRHWGYDLGWVVWPRWFRLPTSEYKNIDAQWEFLVLFVQRVWELAPPYEKKNKEFFMLRCHLVLFERLMGAVFDVVANTPHVPGLIGEGERRVLFTEFIRELLKRNIEMIKKLS